MTDPFDEFLELTALEPPADFTSRIMKRVAAEQPAGTTQAWLAWVAMAAGLILGLGQLAACLFAIWLPANLG